MRSSWQRFTQMTEPIRRAVEAGLITGFYFVVLTPIGWSMRRFGYDPLRRRPLPPGTSLWIATESGGERHAATRPPSSSSRWGLLGEFVQFLREEKKWWLAPLLLMIAVLSLLVAVSASPVAPFIYTLF